MGTSLTASSPFEPYRHHFTPISMLVVCRRYLRPGLSKCLMVSEMRSGIIFCAFLLPPDSLVSKVNIRFSGCADHANVVRLSSSDLEMTRRLNSGYVVSKGALGRIDRVGEAMPSSLALKTILQSASRSINFSNPLVKA